MTFEQQDLLGEPQVVTDLAAHRDAFDYVSWVGADVVREQGVEKSLKLMGVDPGTDRSEGWALRAWRDAMVVRTGMSEAEFRRWVDSETNIYGNRALALFIWAIA